MKRFILSFTILLTFCGNAYAAQCAKSFEAFLTSQRAAGTTLSGGKAYFYAPGTTTLATIYTSRSKTTPAANPYTLSTDGTASVFGDGVYDVKITTSTGVQKSYWYGIELKTKATDASYCYASADLTLEQARVAAECANNTVVVAIVLSQAQSNITDAWPTDRSLRIEKGGSIVNSTAFSSSGSVEMSGGTFSGAGAINIDGPFSADIYQVFTGTSTVSFAEGSVTAVRPEWWLSNTVPGTTDMTAAVQKAINAYPNVILPEKWLATSVINVSRNNFDIGGDKGRSYVTFNPSGGVTDENILFRLYNPLNYPAATHGSRNSRIHHIDFSGVLTNVKRKTAIKVEDGSLLTLDNLFTNINGSWIGQASVGLWLAGREVMSIHTIFFQCERPIVLAINSHFTPQAAGYDIDMFHLYDIALLAQANLNYPLEPSAY